MLTYIKKRTLHFRAGRAEILRACAFLLFQFRIFSIHDFPPRMQQPLISFLLCDVHRHATLTRDRRAPLDLPSWLNLLLLVCFFITAPGAAVADDDAAKGAGEEKPTIAETIEDLNSILDDMASRLEGSRTISIGKKIAASPKRYVKNSLWYDYCGGYGVSGIDKKKGTITLSMGYKDSEKILAAYRDRSLLDQLNKKERVSLQKAEQIIKDIIHPGMTDMERARVIHDFMVKHYSYNLTSGGAATTMLLTDQGVCEAYSRVYYLLTEMAGLEAHIVTGVAGGPHAWNMVRVDGDWHHVDVTWDDCITPTETRESGAVDISRRYFLIDDIEMGKDHTWSISSLPSSQVKDAAYYRKVKKFYGTYPSLWKAVDAAARNKQPNFEGYMQAFTSKDTFLRKFEKACEQYESFKNIIGWNGPEEKCGVVSFQFDYSNTTDKKPREQKPHLVQETVESAKGWLSEQGMHLLEKMDVDEETVEEIKSKGNDVIKKGVDTIRSLF